MTWETQNINMGFWEYWTLEKMNKGHIKPWKTQGTGNMGNIQPRKQRTRKITRALGKMGTGKPSTLEILSPGTHRILGK